MTLRRGSPFRVAASAWLALGLATPAGLWLLLLAISTLTHFLETLASSPDSQKATLLSTQLADTIRTVTGLSALAAAAAVGLGLSVLRSRRKQPATYHTRVAGAAVVIGLLFIPLALWTLLFQ